MKSISQLKRQLDKLVSEYVRRSGADWKGVAACYTCGVKKHYKELQAGHFVSRVYTNLRWSLKNLRIQCYSCNIMRHGNMDEFAARLERESPGIVNELNMWKHRESTPLKRLDLEELIKEFKSKLKEL